MPLTITQEDRDAASGLGCGFCPSDMELALAEAFARHRIQALEAAAKVAEEYAVGVTYDGSCIATVQLHAIAAAIRTLIRGEP